MAQRSSNHMLTKLLALVTSIGLIALIAGEAYARIHPSSPEHLSRHRGPAVNSSSSVHEAEFVFGAGTAGEGNAHRYTGGPKSND